MAGYRGGGRTDRQDMLSFVFRPGGTASDNIYTTWDSLYAAVENIDSPVEIVFDDSFMSINISTPGNYEFQVGTIFRGLSYSWSSLVIGDGVTFNRGDGRIAFSEWRFLNVIVEQDTAPVITTTVPTQSFTLNSCGLLCNGTQPFWQIEGVGGGQNCWISLQDEGQLYTGSAPVVNITNSVAGAILNITCKALALVQPDTIAGDVGMVAVFNQSADINIVSLSHTAFLGTISNQIFNKTFVTRTVYVDGARTDTYPPVDGSMHNPFRSVQAAVDYVEANLTPTVADQVNINIAPFGPYYNETVVIRKSGVNLIGSGLYDTVTIKTLIITNADTASVSAFLLAGGLTDPATNYGLLSAGATEPERNIFQNVNFGDTGADYALLIMGVGNGNNVASIETDFLNCLNNNPTYMRVIGAIAFQTSTLIGAIVTDNITGLFIDDCVFPGGYIGSYDTGADQPANTSNYGLNSFISGAWFGSIGGITLNGSAKVGGASPPKITIDGSLILNDTSTATINSGFIRDNVTVAGNATTTLREVHVQGNFTLDNTGGAVACTMDGGHLVGTLTDAGNRLTASDGVISEDTSRAVTSADRGRTFTNESAGTIVPFTLPTGDDEGPFTFTVINANGIRVTAPASHTIRMGTLETIVAGDIESTEIGASVTIRKLTSTEYVALYGVGTWSVETT